jgi:hypothetical protein
VANPFGSIPGIVVGVGAGGAAAAALEPTIEVPRQKAWQNNAVRILDVNLLARLVAQGGIALGDAHADALRDGFGPDKVDALVYLSQSVPGVSELLFLWRLGIISRGTWREGMTKLSIRPDFVDAMEQTFSVPLTGADVAAMIQRSVIPNQGQLPGIDLVTTGRVPRFPQVDIDAYKSAQAYGMSNDQLDAFTRIQGLPPGMDLVARLVFRDVVDRGDFNLAAEQSNRRVEWADYEFEAYKQIPTARDFVEGYLRGWISEAQMNAGTALHGMSAANTDLLFKVSGRPLAVHQITTGLARGGKYPSTYDDVPEPYRKAIQQSNIRPEWAGLDYANRYSEPSFFVTRALLQDGTLTEAEGEQNFLNLGWRPELAKAAASSYSTAGPAKADTHVGKAQTQLWTATHRSYIGYLSTDADATTALTAAGVSPTTIPEVLTTWKAERDLIRRGLTAANIHKAYNKGDINDATGAAWTRDEAIAALVELGYNPSDAGQYLDIS